jgi:tol-pal system protein YbgF
MSQTFSRFIPLLVILACSVQVNANSSVPVSDLANDIGTESLAISQPVQAVVEEPNKVVLVESAAKVNANTQMLYIVGELQDELRQLRGQVEELNYNLERLKQDQKQRYLDLDRRIVSFSTPPPVTNETQGSSVVNQIVQTNGTSAQVGGATAVEQAIVIQEPYDPEIEKAAYKAAFGLIRERQYDASIEALLAFLTDFPQGLLVGNAHYWLGEVYMVQGDASLAAQSFEYVIREFPDHRKIPDALYKAGVAYQNIGDIDKANQLLRRVLQEYPDSSAARLAHERVN